MPPHQVSESDERALARRTVVQRSAVAVGGLILGIGTVGADEARSEDDGHIVPGKYPPNQNVDFTRVFLFGLPNEQAPTGDWIQHVVGFNPPGDSKEGVKRFIQDHKLSVKIGGDTVEHPKQYWLAARNTEGEWIAVWANTTPPKPPGTYDYSLVIEYLGRSLPLTGEYEVLTPADKSD